MRLLLATLLLLLFAFPVSADPEADFKAANEALEAGRHAEALELYKKVLQEHPTDSVLWNAGLAAAYLEDGAEAAKHFGELKANHPEDPSVRAKLVQAYHLQKDDAAVEKERLELLELRESKPELFEEPFYCREQFKAGERKVVALEFFELLGPRAVKYRFYVLDHGDKPGYVISLGSYEMTNAIMQETGDIPKGQRGYHLDGYYDQGRSHSTFGFYNSEPSYTKVRASVLSIVQGRVSPASSSGPTRSTSE